MILFRYALPACAVFALLSACGGTADFVREKYTGERYGDPVEGPRRAPVLNPGYARPQAPARPAAPQPVVQSNAAPTPYDQYDDKGNEKGGTNYLKQWFGGNSEAQSAAVERKPFKGVAAVVDKPAPVIITPAGAPRAVPQTPVVKESPALAPEENGVVVPLDKQQRVEAPASMQVAQLQPAAPKAPSKYPHLSSVPKAPEQFKAVKATKDETYNELQMNYDAAMEQKKRLADEPTELPPTTLPQVEGMLKEIDGAIHGETPIIIADARAY